MSKESLTWLNTNTLIGFTEARGHAWHWRAEEQGDLSNHYTGAIPLQDVEDRLFCWQAESRRLAVEIPPDVESMSHLTEDGTPARWTPVTGRQAICRSDDRTGNVMGIFGTGYVRHQYREWLLTSVANLLDDDLAISSAGLLKGGAIAWVEVSVPETITTPEGVAFRPNLLATTSFDGSIATTYKRTVTDTVCDNTRSLAMSEDGQEVRIKHSKHSTLQLAPARQALAMIHTLADEFAAEVAKLCAIEVTGHQWSRFLDAYVPTVDAATGKALEGRAKTLAETKRQKLQDLYRSDPRVVPWQGTAHGVIQAVSTYDSHVSTIRGCSRAERNQLKAVSGDFGRLDRDSWMLLQTVLA